MPTCRRARLISALPLVLEAPRRSSITLGHRSPPGFTCSEQMDNLDSTSYWKSGGYPPLAPTRRTPKVPDEGRDPFPALPSYIPTSNSARATGRSPAVDWSTIRARCSRVSATSKPNPPTPSSTSTAIPVEVDIRNLQTPQSASDRSPQLGPSSPSQNNVTSDVRADSQQIPGDDPYTRLKSRLSLWKANRANGESGGAGVGNRQPPTSRVPDSSLLTPTLREALNASITSGRFADTKICLFSHRNSTGDICEPRALYANSMVLKSVPYFNDLFSGNYSESATKDLDGVVAEGDAIAGHYDYDSDSDLEDVEDLGAMGSLNDNPTITDKLHDAIRDDDYILGHCEERLREGRVVRIQDVAFVTFQAFLLCLYTGHIEFAPFGSKDNRKTRATEITSLAPDRVPRPSPKSIYRLADKYDVPTLKSLALNKIKEGLEQCDPVRETFSRFASYYPEILGMHIENLAWILTEVDSGEGQDQLDERLQAFSEGEIDHASDAFSSLWTRLTRDGGGKAPHCTRSSIPSGALSSAVSPPLSIALIKSMRQGSFCDRRYMAKREDTGKWCSPVYISSVVLGDMDWTLSALIAGLNGGEEDSEVDCDSDSDYEDSMEGTKDSGWEDTSSRPGKGPGSAVAATLPIGAFSTWRTLFFYLYTGSVQFAPLKSNSIEARTKYVRENWKPENPPLCSPKSVCYLAGKLGLLHLETAALGDASTKTSAANIVREAFSKSTARLPRLREVQCQLLISSTKNEEIAKATRKHIRDLAGGQKSHRYPSLSLGFKMAIEAKRTALLGTEEWSTVPGPSVQASPECGNSDKPQNKRNRRRKRPATSVPPVATEAVPQPAPVS